MVSDWISRFLLLVRMSELSGISTRESLLLFLLHLRLWTIMGFNFIIYRFFKYPLGSWFAPFLCRLLIV